jgi:hypothetical protein
MSDLGLDSSALSGLLQSLPDVQRRQRLVQQLKDQTGSFQNLQSQPGTGNYTPSQQGGLFPTVQQRMPDYAAAGNQAAGSIGSFLGQQQTNDAQGQLDQSRNAAVLNAVQQMSGGSGGGGGGPVAGASGIAPPGGNPLDKERPTNATIRAYLSLIAGPDMKDIIGTIPHMSKMYVGEDGYEHKVMSDGTEIVSKTKSSLPLGTVTDGDGNVVQYGKVTGNVGSHYLPSPNAPAGAPPTGGTAAGVQLTGGDNLDSIWQKHLTTENATGAINAVSPKGAFGPAQLEPDTADSMEKLLGMQPGLTRTDANANKQAGRTYWDIQRNRFGNTQLASMAYNWGPEKVQALIDGQKKPSDVPAETSAYVDKIYGPGAFQNAMQPYSQQGGGGGGGPQAAPAGPAGTAPPAAGGTAPPAAGGTAPVTTGGAAPPVTTGGAAPAPTGGIPGVVHVLTAGQKAQSLQDIKQQNQAQDDADRAAAGGLEKEVANKTQIKSSLDGMKEKLQIYQQNLKTLANHPGLKYITGTMNPMSILSDSDMAGTKGNVILHGLAVANNLGIGDPKAASDAANAIQAWNNVKASSALAGLGGLKGLLSRVTQMEFKVDADSQNKLARNNSMEDIQAELARMSDMAQKGYDVANNYANSPTERPVVAGQSAPSRTATQPTTQPAPQGLSDEELAAKYKVQ